MHGCTPVRGEPSGDARAVSGELRAVVGGLALKTARFAVRNAGPLRVRVASSRGDPRADGPPPPVDFELVSGNSLAAFSLPR